MFEATQESACPQAHRHTHTHDKHERAGPQVGKKERKRRQPDLSHGLHGVGTFSQRRMEVPWSVGDSVRQGDAPALEE